MLSPVTAPKKNPAEKNYHGIVNMELTCRPGFEIPGKEILGYIIPGYGAKKKSRRKKLPRDRKY